MALLVEESFMSDALSQGTQPTQKNEARTAITVEAPRMVALALSWVKVATPQLFQWVFTLPAVVGRTHWLLPLGTGATYCWTRMLITSSFSTPKTALESFGFSSASQYHACTEPVVEPVTASVRVPTPHLVTPSHAEVVAHTVVSHVIGGSSNKMGYPIPEYPAAMGMVEVSLGACPTYAVYSLSVN